GEATSAFWRNPGPRWCASGSRRSRRSSSLQQLRLLLAREPRVEHAPRAFRAVPIAAGRGLRVLGRARLEEVRVLDAVQDLREPRQRVLADLEERRQPELL